MLNKNNKISNFINIIRILRLRSSPRFSHLIAKNIGLFQISTLLKIFALGLPILVCGTAQAAIHRAPIVIPGYKVRPITRYPISTYRLFKTGPKGEAIVIPFQIDEINEWGDYVLDKGSDITKNTGNGIFDLQDELVFMGDDVNTNTPPKTWPMGKPTLSYEILFKYRDSQGKEISGAVYAGIFFRKPPPLFDGKYVVFDPKTSNVTSSRYRYVFDPRNHLVVNGVDMLTKNDDQKSQLRLLESSTFYMKADLKYFITVLANHRSIDSTIEAYKIGAIRSIVRVSFFYKFLSLKFELGMYTEVSFFSNAVILPAVMYNPINGPKSLNKGSGFYYGFALKDSPADYQVETNMRNYKKTPDSMLGRLFGDGNSKAAASQTFYWISLTKEDRMMYVEIIPSKDMIAADNIPTLYMEKKSAEDMKNRPNKDAKALGDSPVNLGLHFDLTKFTEGEHTLSIKLFFENYFSAEELENFKNLDRWSIDTARIR